MERITGPWAGIFIAAYTTQLHGVFYGYAKLCETRPPDVWSARAVCKVTSRGCDDETEALEGAERRARRVIAAAMEESSVTSLLSGLMSRFK